MAKQSKNLKLLNEILDGYNDLILDEIKTAAEFARKYPNTKTEEIIKYGKNRAKMILVMKEIAITKLLNNI